jgi:hypothetical protein
MTIELKERVKLIMHLPGGYSRVLVESTVGVGLAGGGVRWDIPTEAIPPRLRGLGSRFVVISTSVSGKREAGEMTADQIRAAIRVSVHEITDGEVAGER